MCIAGYGKVVDIRINRGGASGKVPFGFVVFDSDEPVNKLSQLKVSGYCLHTHTHAHQYHSVVLCVQPQRVKLGLQHLAIGFPTPIINLSLKSHKLETVMALVHKAVVI